jgi:hypothetical protein
VEGYLKLEQLINRLSNAIQKPFQEQNIPGFTTGEIIKDIAIAVLSPQLK